MMKPNQTDGYNYLYFVALFIFIVVCSNITVSVYGQLGVILNAIILLPIDMVVRDNLHEKLYHSKYKWLFFIFMFLLGGIISYVLNSSTLIIAIASILAFIISNIVDTVIYDKLFRSTKIIKINVSNLFSAFLDSFLFIIIVFGAEWYLILIQFSSKFILGAFYSYIYTKISN